MDPEISRKAWNNRSRSAGRRALLPADDGVVGPARRPSWPLRAAAGAGRYSADQPLACLGQGRYSFTGQSVEYTFGTSDILGQYVGVEARYDSDYGLGAGIEIDVVGDNSANNEVLPLLLAIVLPAVGFAQRIEESAVVNASLSDFPNLHPLVVHVPIMLLLLAAGTQLATFFLLGANRLTGLRHCFWSAGSPV